LVGTGFQTGLFRGHSLMLSHKWSPLDPQWCNQGIKSQTCQCKDKCLFDQSKIKPFICFYKIWKPVKLWYLDQLI